MTIKIQAVSNDKARIIHWEATFDEDAMAEMVAEIYADRGFIVNMYRDEVGGWEFYHRLEAGEMA